MIKKKSSESLILALNFAILHMPHDKLTSHETTSYAPSKNTHAIFLFESLTFQNMSKMHFE
jgi:hypothetical protein